MRTPKTDLALALAAVDKFRDKKAVANIVRLDPQTGKSVVVGIRKQPAWHARVDVCGPFLRFSATGRRGKCFAQISFGTELDELKANWRGPVLVDPDFFRAAVDASLDSVLNLEFDGERFVLRSSSGLATTKIDARPIAREDSTPSDDAGFWRGAALNDGYDVIAPRFWSAVDAATRCVGDVENRGSSRGVVVDLEGVVYGCSRSFATFARDVSFGLPKDKTAAPPSFSADPAFLGLARGILSDAAQIYFEPSGGLLTIFGKVGARTSIAMTGSTFENIPDWRPFFALKPSNPQTLAVGVVGETLATLRRADLCSDAEKRGVQITFEPSDAGGGTLVAAARSEVGRAEARTPVELKGERIVRWIEAPRAIGFLSGLDKSALVEFSIDSDPKRPFFVSSGDRTLVAGFLSRDYAI